MEDSRTGPVPGAPHPAHGAEHQAAWPRHATPQAPWPHPSSDLGAPRPVPGPSPADLTASGLTASHLGAGERSVWEQGVWEQEMFERAAWERAAWDEQIVPDGWAAPNEWTGWEQPSERAHPLLMLTPAADPRAPREPWTGAVHVVVTGIAVLLIGAELGRRAGVPARLAAVCSAAGVAVVLVPRLASAAPRVRPRPRSRHRSGDAVAVG